MDKGPALFRAHMSILINNLTDAINIIPDVPPFFVNLLCRPDLAHLPPAVHFSALFCWREVCRIGLGMHQTAEGHFVTLS